MIPGDALAQLRKLPAESAHCVITSPPYWGLRDYGLPPLAWEPVRFAPMPGMPDLEAPAWQGCLGLEPEPILFVAHMVAIFREVRRVLRADGTCWVNLGDCYATGAGRVGDDKRGYRGDRLANGRGDQPAVLRRKTRATRDGSHSGRHTAIAAMGPMTQPNSMPIQGLKPKDLVGLPWRVALALQADGWWLRSDVVWNKPNPMPESVADRPTKAHEYLFLLTKRGRYFYDAKAIREPRTSDEDARGFRGGAYVQGRAFENSGTGGKRADIGNDRVSPEGKRNKRSVWTVATQPFPEAHFATFPPKLIEPCVLAGTSARGCCLACGAPVARKVVKVGTASAGGGRRAVADAREATTRPQGPTGAMATGEWATYATAGWEGSCSCAAPVVPCTVLDPFNGAGTTGVVAVGRGRSYLGIELNPDYLAMSEQRIAGVAPLLARQVR